MIPVDVYSFRGFFSYFSYNFSEKKTIYNLIVGNGSNPSLDSIFLIKLRVQFTQTK